MMSTTSSIEDARRRLTCSLSMDLGSLSRMREPAQQGKQLVRRLLLPAGGAAGIIRQHHARRVVYRRPHTRGGHALVQILVRSRQLFECRCEFPLGQRLVLIELRFADDTPEVRVVGG